MTKNDMGAPNSDFIDSLNSLSQDDVVPQYRRSKKKKAFSLYKFTRVMVILMCIAVFIYCISELSSIVEDYNEGDDLYNEIADGFFAAINGSTQGNVTHMNLSKGDVPLANYADVLLNGVTKYEPPEDEIIRVTTSLRFRALLAYIEGLKDLNPDTYGYINIPNSQINYPMVQREDNDYYLTHAFDGRPLAVGAIFVDCRNEKEVENNRNIVIYGHNMLNGSMFCDATKYLDEAFFMNPNNVIEIATFDGLYTFEVFAAYPTDKYDNYFKTYFPTDEEFVKFCTDREAKSLYHKEGMTFSEKDVIVTLSTCILGNDDGRYAIHAKLVKIET